MTRLASKKFRPSIYLRPFERLRPAVRNAGEEEESVSTQTTARAPEKETNSLGLRVLLGQMLEHPSQNECIYMISYSR